MNRYKYLFKNIGLLTISNFGSKLLSFLLVPLYTNILSTEEYGAYDLVSTTISLLLPIFTVEIFDAALRFMLDKNSDKASIFSISIKISGLSYVPLSVLLIFNRFIPILSAVNDYLGMFVLYYTALLLLYNMQNFARGLDRINDVAVSGIINTAVKLILNIVFLIYLKAGITGYFLANILGDLAAVLYIFIHAKAWKYIKFKNLPKPLEKDMVTYSKPLAITMIGWWINNASDRYIVTWLCGVAANGIYSIGYKIPSILNIFQTIFNQAWQLSTVKELDSSDSNKFYTGLYNSYNILMVLICSVLIGGARIMAKFLYAKDFFTAWQYVPFLMIAIVFGAMSGFVGGIFQAEKDSKIQSRSTLIGACCNVVLNIVLTYRIGALGAAIATAVSYYIVWVIRMRYVKKYVQMELKIIRDHAAYIILVVQSCLLFIFSDSVLLYLLEVLFVIAILLLYLKECKELLKKGILFVKR